MRRQVGAERALERGHRLDGRLNAGGVAGQATRGPTICAGRWRAVERWALAIAGCIAIGLVRGAGGQTAPTPTPTVAPMPASAEHDGIDLGPGAREYRTDESAGGEVSPWASELERRFPGMCASPGLCRAADASARVLGLRDMVELPADLTDFALRWAGCPDAAFSGVVVFTTEDGLAEVDDAVERALLDSSTSPTHFGVGRFALSGHKFRWLWVVLFADRRIVLLPFARQAEVGRDVPIGFALPSPYVDARVVTTWPDGTTRLAHARLRDGQWSADTPISREPGEQQVEVVATGRYGPEVLALMSVSVSRAPSTLWRGGSESCPRSVSVVAADAERGLLTLANRERAARGVPPLELDEALVAVARGHADEMAAAGFFAHVSPVAGGLRERLRVAGIAVQMAGENIAKGDCVAQVHASLMASPGHRATLLDKEYTRVGIGVALAVSIGGRGVLVVTQDFAKPLSGTGKTR